MIVHIVRPEDTQGKHAKGEFVGKGQVGKSWDRDVLRLGLISKTAFRLFWYQIVVETNSENFQHQIVFETNTETTSHPASTSLFVDIEIQVQLGPQDGLFPQLPPPPKIQQSFHFNSFSHLLNLQTSSALFRSEMGRKWKILVRSSGGSLELMLTPVLV